MPTIVEADESHLGYLEAHLRVRDREELYAACGMDPHVALIFSYHASDLRWTIIDDAGNPAAMFGVGPGYTPQDGLVWLLGTDAIDTMRTFVLRHSVPYITKMHGLYPLLHNFVDARNVTSMSWLEWCGFSINDVDPAYGVGRVPFIHYARHQPCAVQ